MRNRKGFTLIEMMVVISIILVLAGMAVPVTAYLIKEGKRRKATMLLGQVSSAMTSLRLKYGYQGYIDCGSGTAAGDKLIKALTGQANISTISQGTFTGTHVLMTLRPEERDPFGAYADYTLTSPFGTPLYYECRSAGPGKQEVLIFYETEPPSGDAIEVTGFGGAKRFGDTN